MMLEIKFITVKECVHMRYHWIPRSTASPKLVIEQTAKSENKNVDGEMFSKNHGVVISGTLSDKKLYIVKPQTFNMAWDP